MPKLANVLQQAAEAAVLLAAALQSSHADPASATQRVVVIREVVVVAYPAEAVAVVAPRASAPHDSCDAPTWGLNDEHALAASTTTPESPARGPTEIPRRPTQKVPRAPR